MTPEQKMESDDQKKAPLFPGGGGKESPGREKREKGNLQTLRKGAGAGKNQSKA